MSNRTGIQLAYPFEEKRLAKWRPPWILQPKLDGVRCRALISREKVTLLSSEGNEIISVPHLNRQLLAVALEPGLELDGELYLHGMPFEEIFSRVSREVNAHSGFDEIEYHVFDLIDEGQRQDLRLLDLIEKVQEPTSRLLGSSIRVVPLQVISTFTDLMHQYEAYLKMGYEGFILRHMEARYVRKRSTYMMKFKPKKVDIYRIAGAVQEYDQHGTPKHSLGSIACNSDDEIFYVGTGFTREQREELWKVRDQLVGQYLEVAYQHLTSERGVPRFPVFKRIISPEEFGAASAEITEGLGETPQTQVYEVMGEDDGYAD
jgi:ATP-dependent DNA ligase